MRVIFFLDLYLPVCFFFVNIFPFFISLDLETDEVINKVLDEIGIDLGGQLASAPQDITATEEKPQKQPTMIAEGGGIDADLQARLNNLKNN